MATIPATPTFMTSSVASLTSLSNLSTLVELGAQYQIGWRVYANTTSTIASASSATLAWNAAAWNPDSNWSSSSDTLITINTQGFYDSAIMLCTSGSAVQALTVELVVTHSATTTSYIMVSETALVSGSGSQPVYPMVIPQELYVNDTLKIVVAALTGFGAIEILPVGNGAAFSGSSVDYAGIRDGGTWWSGRLLSLGGTP